MKTLEQRIEALDAKSGIVQEPWKPSKPTLCWVSDDNDTDKVRIEIIVKRWTNCYNSLYFIQWCYATPLTRAEVMEYLDDSEKDIEKTAKKYCTNCGFTKHSILKHPCKGCFNGGGKDPAILNWTYQNKPSTKSRLEARPE